MDQDRFETAVVALASDGVPLTVANVSARTGVSPRKAEAMLDEMVRTHHLESDVDEKLAVVVYRVRGLSPNVKRVRVAELESRRDRSVDDRKHDLAMAAGEVMVRQAASRAKAAVLTTPKEGEKSVALGGLLGLLGPIGLVYSAPWNVVGLGVAAQIAFVLLMKLPLLGALLYWLVPLLLLASAFAGAAYAWRYNQNGKRTPLLPPERKTA